jgi:parallel beta-helix repeat protein
VHRVEACSLMIVSLSVFVGTPPAGRQVGGPAMTPRVHYVAASARADGIGSLDRPWTLAAALEGADGSVSPGDTVWLRGGIYRGAFRTSLEGAPGRWIVFRQFPGERATIDGTLRADGAYLAFWGFEIMQSTPSTYGLEANTDYGRFIDLVIHDAGKQGILFWTPGVDAELYGCIVYNNGTHERLDHGVYVHNEEGTKRLVDNVFFNNLGVGIHVYASHKNPVIRNVRVEGNVAFNNGAISVAEPGLDNVMINGQVPIEGMVAVDNMLYFSGRDGVNLSLGTYSSVNNRDISVQGNYMAGGRIGLEMVDPWQHAVVTGNTISNSQYLVDLAGDDLVARYTWAGNMWIADSGALRWRLNHTRYDWQGWRLASSLGETDQRPTDSLTRTKVFVRPNRYEPGRALLVVYNWAHQGQVVIDVSAVLRLGARYEVHNVQALFENPVVSGLYRGEPIVVPMDGVEPPVPIGRPTRPPPRTGPAFDVFLLTSESP